MALEPEKKFADEDASTRMNSTYTLEVVKDDDAHREDDLEKGDGPASDSGTTESTLTPPTPPAATGPPRTSILANDGPDTWPTGENIVDWEGEDDPEHPWNWPNSRKYVNAGLVSLLTFVDPLASSIFAPGIPKLMQDFGSSNQELAALVVSIYVLGFAFGPLFVSPLSEMVGRVPVYHACNVMFLVFIIGCAVAPTLDSLIVFRFLSGTFGAAPMVIGGGSIADMFRPEERANIMAAFTIGPLLGPIIGPVIGGFLTDAKGWRWDFWVMLIVEGVITLAMFFAMRESYTPVILEKKAARLRKETGNMELKSKMDRGLTPKELLKLSIVRPVRLLLFSPICAVFAIYVAVVYGYLYLLFTSVPFVFGQVYGFGTKTVGLVYLGLGIGSFIGMALFAWDSNNVVKKHFGKDGLKPEMRLKLMPAASFVFPAGFFIYGWTADYQTHWIGPIVGLAVIGIGNLVLFMAASVYLVDAFEIYAASALAANTIIRSIVGAVLPLCGLRMYDKLGLGWGNSMLGFIAVAMIPAPVLIVRYGEKLRTKYVIKDL